MSLSLNERTSLIKLAVAMFNVAPGATYLAEITGLYEANGRSLDNVAAILSNTPAYKAMSPVFQTAAEFATAFLTPLGLQANGEAKDYIVAKFNAYGTGVVNKGQISLDASVALANYTGTDTSLLAAKATLDNKTAVATYYSVDKQIASTDLAALKAVLVGVTADVATVATGKAAVDGTATAATVTTFTLTNGVDNLVGTAGNDNFIGDNTGGAANRSVSAADQINGGAGIDTFNYYVLGTGGAVPVPQLTNVENVNLIGNTALAAIPFTPVAITANFTSAVGLQQVTLKDTTTGGSIITLGAGVAAGLDNVKSAGNAETFVFTATQTAAGVNVVNGTNMGRLNLDGALVTTLNVVSAAGAANTIGELASTGLGTTLNISGAGNLTINAVGPTLTTINAATATGSVSVDVSANTVAPTFKFIGGAGNDTLTLNEAGLNALVAGSQLSGGAGIDTLKINKAAGAFTTADYKAINATSGFEILGLNTAAGDTVDASQLTTIKELGVYGGTNVISKVAAGTTLDIFAATTKTTVSGAISVSDLAINIGTAASTTGTANSALDITGLTNVTINSSIKAGTVGAANVIGTLFQSDNSSFTIKGNGDTTLALAAATMTGSKIDGSAATGKLVLTGNTATFDATKAALGDILIGGSANDTITVGANSTTVTGGAGNDSFVVAGAVVGSATAPVVTTITDFTKGDSIKFDANFATTAAFNKVDLSGLTTGQTDVQVFTALAAKSTAAGSVEYGIYNGVTYVLEDNNSGTVVGTFDVRDIAVKLTGVLDLTTSTHAATSVLVFA